MDNYGAFLISIGLIACGGVLGGAVTNAAEIISEKHCEVQNDTE